MSQQEVQTACKPVEMMEGGHAGVNHRRGGGGAPHLDAVDQSREELKRLQQLCPKAVHTADLQWQQDATRRPPRPRRGRRSVRRSRRLHRAVAVRRAREVDHVIGGPAGRALDGCGREAGLRRLQADAVVCGRACRGDWDALRVHWSRFSRGRVSGCVSGRSGGCAAGWQRPRAQQGVDVLDGAGCDGDAEERCARIEKVGLVVVASGVVVQERAVFFVPAVMLAAFRSVGFSTDPCWPSASHTRILRSPINCSSGGHPPPPSPR